MFQTIALILILTNVYKFADSALIIQDLTDGTNVTHAFGDDDNAYITISSPIYLQNPDGSTYPQMSFRVGNILKNTCS